jgi:hypothetical protein
MSTSTHLLVAFLLCTVLCVSPVSGKVLKVPGEHPTIDAAVGIASDGDQLSFEGGGGRVAHCNFDGAGDDAVDADDSVSYVVEHRTFDNVKEDADETRLQPKSGPLTMHVFRYNTVFKAGQSGIQLVDYAGDSKRTFRIYGNLFLNCEGSGVGMMANEHSDDRRCNN